MAAKRKESVTLQEIAERLRVSASTVSRALNNNPRISKETREAVWKLANEMDYQPYFPDFAKVNRPMRTIGLLVPNFSNPIYIETYNILQEEALTKGYQVVVLNSGNRPEVEKQIITDVKNLGLCGLVISFSDTTTNCININNPDLKGFPIVAIHRVNFNLQIPRIIIDNFQGAFLATNHLLTMGCNRIALLIGKKSCPIYSEILKGYKQALSKNGLALKQEYVVSSSLTESDVDASLDILYRLNEIPDAIITANPNIAIQIISRLKDENIRVPEDIAIVTIGNHSLLKYWTPTITCVEVNNLEFARATTKKFFETLQKTEIGQSISPDTSIITTRLSIRGSSIKR
ncbi:MAG: LacI family transcriptional regulator [Bacteroidales bacterium]|nr:MAG: LacI family transcriptional regulator [Bacteroidales bacterium]